MITPITCVPRTITGEEEHNEQGVDDGKPVDLVVVTAGHGKVDVPTGGPFDGRGSPLDVVGPDYLASAINVLVRPSAVKGWHGAVSTSGRVLVARGELAGALCVIPRLGVLVFDSKWLYEEANNTTLLDFAGDRVVTDNNLHVIVQCRALLLDSADGETNVISVTNLSLPRASKTWLHSHIMDLHGGLSARFFVVNGGCRGKVVHNPVAVVAVLDGLNELVCLGLIEVSFSF